ncbi:MAG: peptide-methionine (S)-S-oxide reductase MsrA [Clostridia bacterium]|nr:peptide-methionine (S)-S-oxide reductase MsrA [Clostridia bacterium]
MNTIYLAGGCYWGVEKYISNIPGVKETEVGFANGLTHNPTYQQVRYENTGHAETVRVVYDETVLPPDKLLRLFFRIIDPVSVDKQGEDEGHQYRTGIYFTDEKTAQVAREELAKLADAYDQPLAVECCELQHFYTAEEYHQKYLDKNPAGYCHVPWTAINDVKNVDLSKV